MTFNAAKPKGTCWEGQCLPTMLKISCGKSNRQGSLKRSAAVSPPRPRGPRWQDQSTLSDEHQYRPPKCNPPKYENPIRYAISAGPFISVRRLGRKPNTGDDGEPGRHA